MWRGTKRLETLSTSGQAERKKLVPGSEPLEETPKTITPASSRKKPLR